MAVPKGEITSLTADVQASLTYGDTRAARRSALNSDPATWFGPLQPLPPLAPPGVGGRRWDYPFGLNLQYIPRGTENISFRELRALADSLPILRAVIETRKDQIASLPWLLRPVPEEGVPKRSRVVTPGQKGSILDIKAFLRRPDGVSSYATWLRSLIEEMLVTDAACIYPRPTLDGGIFSLDVIDGSTIKPLIDGDGRRPMPPDPAFQQILKGIVAADLTSDELLYLPRNVRASRVYGYCFAPGTEILTKSGWVGVDKVRYEDLLATRHPVTHEFQWQSPIALTKRDFDGDLVHFFGGRGGADVLVTPDHNMIVHNRISGREVLMTADELARKPLAGCRWRIPLAADSWNGVRIVEKVFANEAALDRNVEIRSLRREGSTYAEIAERVGCSQMTAHDVVSERYAYDGRGAFKVDRLSGENFCAFMGMFLSEGSTNKGRITIITQSKAPFVEKFRAKLTECFGLVEYDGKDFCIHRTRLTEYVSQFGKSYEKFVPGEIMNATSGQIGVFLEYLFDGDAHRNRNGQTLYYTTSRLLADQVQELCQKIGQPASVAEVTPRGSVMADGREILAENCRTQYRVSVNRDKFISVRSKRVRYAGLVHCVSVPNKSVLVRRNGKAAWTSQSPVEQIIMTINVALRREISNLEYYRSGTVPDSFGTLPKEWTIDQIKQFQDYFDSLMQGNTQARSGMRFMPSDFKYEAARQPALQDKYDEWLARLICYAFSVPPTPFVATTNRATAETIRVQASQEGLVPLQQWVKHFMDHIVQDLLGNPDLEFAWSDGDTIDPAIQMQVLTGYVAAGIKSRDEVRDEIGEGPIADGTGGQHTVAGALSPARLPTPEEQQQQHAQQLELTAARKPEPGAPPAEGGSDPAAKLAKEFEESQHPRDYHGRFAPKGGGDTSSGKDRRPRDANGQFIYRGGSSRGLISARAKRNRLVEGIKNAGERAAIGAALWGSAAVVSAVFAPTVGTAVALATAVVRAVGVAALGEAAGSVALSAMEYLGLPESIRDTLHTAVTLGLGAYGVADAQDNLSQYMDVHTSAQEKAAAIAARAERAKKAAGDGETSAPEALDAIKAALYEYGQATIARMKTEIAAKAQRGHGQALGVVNDELESVLEDFLDHVDKIGGEVDETPPEGAKMHPVVDISAHPIATQKVVRDDQWRFIEGGAQNSQIEKAVGERRLYAGRNLVNGDAVRAWMQEQGFVKGLEPDDMHVTTVYSETPLAWPPPSAQQIVTASGGERTVEVFGKGAVVLTFKSPHLEADNARLKAAGATSSFPDYRPHLTLTYDAGALDLSKVTPFPDALVFGPEFFAEIKDGWHDEIVEMPLDKMAKAWKTLEPMWQAPAAEDAAVSRYRKILTAAFAKAAPKVAAFVQGKLVKAATDFRRPLRKAADDIGDDLPLDDISSTAGDLADVAADTANEVSRGALARVGVGTGNDDIVNSVSAKAVAQARARAAELVGMSWDEESQSYVDNPNPDMAITDSTREMIRDIITNGLANNLGADEIASQIESSTGFSPERADLVAKTEIARVNSDAALSAYRDAAAAGVLVKKRWIVAAQDVCDECTANSKQGPIDLDEEFQSGDLAPPLHPNCRCAVSPVVIESDDSGDPA